MQHLGHALDRSGSLGRALRVVAGDKHMHVAAALRSGRNGVEGRALEGAMVVFSDDESGHDASCRAAPREASASSGGSERM